MAVFVLTWCLPQTATQHHNTIVTQRNAVTTAQDVFLTEIRNNDLGTTDLQDEFELLVDAIQLAQAQLELIQPFKDSIFLADTKSILKEQESFITETYQELVDLYALPKEEIQTEQYDRFAELADLENEKRLTLTDEFIQSQTTFTETYNIQ